MSRWVALGILNIWIFCAIRNCAPFEHESRRWVWARVLCAAAMAPILYPKTVYVSGNYLYPSPVLEKVLETAIGPPIYKTQEDCDPNVALPLVSRLANVERSNEIVVARSHRAFLENARLSTGMATKQSRIVGPPWFPWIAPLRSR